MKKIFKESFKILDITEMSDFYWISNEHFMHTLSKEYNVEPKVGQTATIYTQAGRWREFIGIALNGKLIFFDIEGDFEVKNNDPDVKYLHCVSPDALVNDNPCKKWCGDENCLATSREDKQFFTEDEKKLEAVRSVIEKHTEKLNIMKENFSMWDEENWNDAEVEKCLSNTQILAAILRDLKRSINS